MNTRIFGPMLQPDQYPVPVGHQYHLFVPTPERSSAHGSYVPAWVAANRPVTSADRRVFIPPTAVQVEAAIRRIESTTEGAPRARRQSLEALEMFIQGMPLCDVIESTHRGHAWSMVRRAAQLALSGIRIREIRRRLTLETILAHSAPSRAFSVCRKFCNGF